MNVALLISGGGTTAQAIIEASRDGKLKGLVNPSVVIASRKGAGGIEKALERGIPVEVIDRTNFSSQEAFGEKILSVLVAHSIDVISQNGWLPLTPKNVLEAFPQKIINQHPGPLDPGREDFGGKGMFGARVTCARVLYCYLTKDEHPFTESTVHFVTEEFDKGSIINIVTFPFAQLDRKISLEQVLTNMPVREFIINITRKIQQELLFVEHKNVINTLLQFAKNEINHFTREEPLIPNKNIEILRKVKHIAAQLFPEG